MAGPCISLGHKSMSVSRDHSFVNGHEEQEEIVTDEKRRGKEIEKGNNINPVEYKKISHYLCALQEDTKIQGLSLPQQQK